MVDSIVSSDQVLQELLLLRQRDGLTLRKLKEKCPGLLALRMTTDELERRHLAASDRHLAALGALECAVRVLIARPDHARILTRTLNIQARVDSSLEYRQDTLRIELSLSEKEFRRVQQEAYLQLAAELVMAETSPCAQDSQLGDKLVLEIKLHGSPDQLAVALDLLTFESRPGVRQEIAERILQSLPNARRILDELGIAEDALAILLQALITARWTTVDASGQSYFLAESVRLLLSQPEKPLEVRAVDISQIEAQHDRQAIDFRYESERVTTRFFTLKHEAMQRLAELAIDVERADDWDQIFGEPRTVHDLAPVT